MGDKLENVVSGRQLAPVLIFVKANHSGPKHHSVHHHLNVTNSDDVLAQ